MTSEIRTFAPRAIALCGVGLLIGASACLGAYYGYTIGAHIHLALGAIFASAALGGEILKPLAIVAAVDAAKHRQLVPSLACSLLAIVCIAYSFTAELSLSATSRSDQSAQRAHTADIVAATRASRDRALTELQAIAPARPVAELRPLADKLRMTPGANGCMSPPDGPISRRVCSQVEALKAEAARALRRVELEQTIKEAATRLAELRHVSDTANPAAVALGVYTAALGFPTSPNELAPWLALIPVLFLEFGSAFGLLAVRQLASSSPGKPLPPPNSDTGRTVACSDDEDDRGPKLGARVLKLIETSGGKIEGGQRGIAKALGISKSRVNELLHELAVAGRVRLDTCRKGTTVRLAPA